MNKSSITNLAALALFIVGWQLDHTLLYYAGLFALSGALTNWLAVHMLFEKVPGLYGSGVIPARFEEFKVAIKTLMMNEFFTKENIDRFLKAEMNSSVNLNVEPILEQVNFDSTFDSLVDVINQSQFGGMLAMVGGAEALEPLKAPFIERMQQELTTLTQQPAVQKALIAQFEQPEMMADIQEKIDAIIEQRLNELTPQLVKEMVQKMIHQHLGWLVVWGGIFGGVIGVISALFVI
ncbi:DUF445 domain-containing protein [Thaumasiovibrio subtropicus]|uniref:DUF445 domain-containing protein n=1 Tax=Thaumasiovibrio subtropicus TaxID=1891207 RepID=UPI000B352D5A|nr:DUF445 domain-containing protein [Thaumasiovibrio subtropicus]